MRERKDENRIYGRSRLEVRTGWGTFIAEVINRLSVDSMRAVLQCYSVVVKGKRLQSRVFYLQFKDSWKVWSLFSDSLTLKGNTCCICDFMIMSSSLYDLRG